MKTKTITFFAALALLLAFAQNLFAQQSAITGKVLDTETNNPIEFASVLLLRQDSTLVSGTNSTMEGTFEIKDVPEGNYLLSVSSIGYKKSYTSVNQATNNNYLELALQPSSVTTSEVTIKAQSVINKADRKVILPSKSQIKASSDGLELMKMLQLPRIMVDPMSNEVSVSGNGEVQLRINGVLVSNAEIAAINPEDIIRVEYHDDPGARYGNATAVIDYIIRHKDSGGSVRGSAMHGIDSRRTSADDLLSGKFNVGKSEFSVNARFIQRKGKWTREYDEKFISPTNEIHRLEVGEPTLFNKKVFYTNLNYSIQEKDKYFFNTQFSYNYQNFPAGYEDRKSKLYTSNSANPLSIWDHSTEKTNSPALDLYYQRNLTNNQLLIFNVVGTYISSDNSRIYQEEREGLLETDIFSAISGKKYSVIGEAIYENKIGQGKLTGGIKHLQSYTNNEYRGTTTADVFLRQAESSVYAEYQGKIGQWGYMANLTGVRMYYSQNDENKERFAIQPSARITFEPNKSLYFRYRIGLRDNMPSLAYLNDVEQVIDPLQVRRGNPNLNSFSSLNQNFNTGYISEFWSVDALVNYNYEFKPIMESVIYESGLFVRTYENQKSFQNLGAEVTFKVKPWKNYISLSVSPRVTHYVSKGNNYSHTYTMKEVRFNLDLFYKNWMANFITITPPDRYVYGEQLLKGSLMHTIMAGYKANNWSFMLGIHNPFIKTYKATNENWSAINPVKSEIHSTNMTRSIVAKLSFNFNYGKQYKSGNKRTNNTDTESGIISGTKQ